jgi:hypothetical protein
MLYTKQIYKNSIKKDSGNTFFILKRTKSSQIRLVEFPLSYQERGLGGEFLGIVSRTSPLNPLSYQERGTDRVMVRIDVICSPSLTKRRSKMRLWHREEMSSSKKVFLAYCILDTTDYYSKGGKGRR